MSAASEPLSTQNIGEALRQTAPLLPRLILAGLLLVVAPEWPLDTASGYLVQAGMPVWLSGIANVLAKGGLQGLYVGVVAILLAPRLGLVAAVKPVDRHAGWIGWIAVVLVAGVLKTLIISMGLILLVIPGVIANCMLFIVLPVAALERRDPGEAITRSRELTRDYRFGIFGVLLVLGIAVTVFGFAGMVGFGGMSGFQEARLQPGYSYGYEPLINLVYATLLAVLQTSFYVRRALRTSAGAQSVAAVFD
ncbi:hypothetical protein QO010_001915 [Caulobacter ginsengisoli]|uniref:Glycerophosphoryl diester phosphodiesterase membrane domain-containing protein n=1 Tax=Caulobacter ginsengisoli TaxID=400775 RepID=A0ABU0ISY0_9CAUL|nr:hypothetical protein [Caulobacter ginsengisoli]MDQ0464144.1 hypothetical protein [Caulobacter ginsengisoli]